VFLCRFYAADVRRESFEVFDRCKRKVVVTANPTVMVDAFVKDYLGGDKVLGTEIEVNPKTKKATVLVGDLILPPITVPHRPPPSPQPPPNPLILLRRFLVTET
jgi:hypothetical protein